MFLYPYNAWINCKTFLFCAEKRGLTMNIYTTDKIRNVVLLGHGGAGKTSLVEAMGYLAGLTSRMGKVSDKNTISDYGKEEQKRQFSISTSVVPLEWEGCKINILDTPGYFDFVGEAEEAASAADAAIIVVSGKAGIELPAGHVVRQHADGRRAILGPPATVSGEWKKYEFIIVKGISPDAKATNKLFPGVAKISPLLVVPGAVNIKEFKLEKIK